MGLIKRHVRKLYRRRIRRPVQAKLSSLVRSWCRDCERNVDPFHTCAPRSDFKRRRAQQARAEKRRQGSRPRERRPPHDWHTCPDTECPVRVCVAFREGRDSCPGPHQ